MSGHAHEKPVVLITGSSGLIGTRLVDEFMRDFNVVGLDIKPPKRRAHEACRMPCDLTSDENVRETLDRLHEKHGGRIASVLHLAAYYDFSGEPSPLYRELTVEGTRRLLRALSVFEVEQFVFSSSLLVMKPVEWGGARLTETSPTRAEWDYPQSKLQAERVVREEQGDIPAVILRMAGVYDEDGHSLPICHHIQRIYEKQLESYFFPGFDGYGQPFVHLDDLTACFRKAVEKRRALDAMELFLIAEPDVMSYRQLQDRLGELLHGQAWTNIRIPKSVAKLGAWVKDKLPNLDPFIKPWMIDLADHHYPVEIERARRLLDWTPEHALSSSLEEMVRRMLEDPEAWYKENGLRIPKHWPKIERLAHAEAKSRS